MTRTDGSIVADEAVAPGTPDNGRVILPEVTEPILEEPFLVFDEWQSEADRSAFAGL